MKSPARLRIALIVLVCSLSPLLAGATEPGKPQQCTSPDQVPEGLVKSDWQSIRAAYEAGQHAFQPIAGGWQARNPGQQWTTKFDARGFVAEPKDGGWQWGLELKSYGFGENQHVIGSPGQKPAVRAVGQRLSYQWNPIVQEWWVNDARGLEHGFTVQERPVSSRNAPSSTLNFLLATRGSLKPSVSADALGVLFKDANGATVINYTGLKVWDADGKVLDSHFASAEGGVRLLVDERDARYPITIDPVAQQAFLKPGAVGTTQSGDGFGISVAVSGDTVVVGASSEDSSTTSVNSTPNESAPASGAAYIFVRGAGGVWTQQAYLKPAVVGTQAGDNFGYSVAISGDTVIVGAFQEDSSTTGVNSTANESASLSGAAYIFVRSGVTWTQQAYLKPGAVGTTQAGDYFGYSVAISGDTAVVASLQDDSSTTGVNSVPNESASDAGAVYIFVRNGATWTQQAYLKPAAIGTTQVEDYFGTSVAIAGDTVAVGAPYEDSSTTGVNSTSNESAADAGAVYIFVRSGVTWTQQSYLKPTTVGTTQAGDGFGSSVALSGDSLVVGAYQEDSGTTGVNTTPNESGANSGAAYIFVRSGVTWTQQSYLKPSAVGTTQEGDFFGISAGISGDMVVVGAAYEDSSTTGVNSTPNESASLSGAAYIFVRSGVTWTQQSYLKPAAVGATQAVDQFGYSVAVSGETVVIGAAGEDSSTTGVNSTPNETGANPGGAYVFAPFPTVTSPTITSITTTSATLGGNVTGDGGATITGRGVVFAPTAINPEPTVGGTGVTVVPTSGTIGTFTIPVTLTSGTAYSFKAYVTNPFGTAYTIAGTFTTLGAEIGIEQPVGVNLTSGTASIGFSSLPPGSSAAKTFTITNSGTVALTITNVTVTGGNTADFAVNTSGMLTSVPTNSGTTFSVIFTPAIAGNRTTTLRIRNDDTDEGIFDITLTGTGLSSSTDTDGDGLNDVSEFNMAALGFNWQVSQPALVTTYYTNANGAGLFTAGQVQALNVGTPLIQKNPGTGTFTLTIGVQKSTTLLPGSFNPFPMTSPQTLINGTGKLEFEFSAPDNAAFYRLQSQ